MLMCDSRMALMFDLQPAHVRLCSPMSMRIPTAIERLTIKGHYRCMGLSTLLTYKVVHV